VEAGIRCPKSFGQRRWNQAASARLEAEVTESCLEFVAKASYAARSATCATRSTRLNLVH